MHISGSKRDLRQGVEYENTPRSLVNRTTSRVVMSSASSSSASSSSSSSSTSSTTTWRPASIAQRLVPLALGGQQALASACSRMLDGYSRYIVHWDLRESMTERDVEFILQHARELFPATRPRIVTDKGPQFIAHALRPAAPTTIDETRRVTADFVEHYNARRLHRARRQARRPRERHLRRVRPQTRGRSRVSPSTPRTCSSASTHHHPNESCPPASP